MRALALQGDCDLLCIAPIAICLEAEEGEADPFARLGSAERVQDANREAAER